MERRKHFSSEHPLRIRNGYLVGLVWGLRQRFELQSQQVNASSETAIVLHTQQLKLFLEAQVGKLGQRQQPPVSEAAFNAGLSDADKVGLNRSLPTGIRKQLPG